MNAFSLFSPSRFCEWTSAKYRKYLVSIPFRNASVVPFPYQTQYGLSPTIKARLSMTSDILSGELSRNLLVQNFADGERDDDFVFFAEETVNLTQRIAAVIEGNKNI